jgi:hypothetical protein
MKLRSDPMNLQGALTIEKCQSKKAVRSLNRDGVSEQDPRSVGCDGGKMARI